MPTVNKLCALGLLGLVLMMPPALLAQPIQGAYDAGCDGTFLRFSSIADWEDFTPAVECSRRTGRLWLLLAGFADPIGQPVDAEGLKRRADQSGLTPYIAGIGYREEWYGMLKRGEIPLPLTIESIGIVHRFGSEQQRRLKVAFVNKPIVYVDGFVNDDKKWGFNYYQPLPLHTDVFGFEAYVPNGGSWAMHVLPAFNHHLRNYPTLPLVVIGQGFQTHEGEWSEGPTVENVDNTLALGQHPRVVSIMWFTWRSRSSMIGLERMPTLLARMR